MRKYRLRTKKTSVNYFEAPDYIIGKYSKHIQNRYSGIIIRSIGSNKDLIMYSDFDKYEYDEIKSFIDRLYAIDEPLLIFINRNDYKIVFTNEHYVTTKSLLKKIEDIINDEQYMQKIDKLDIGSTLVFSDFIVLHKTNVDVSPAITFRRFDILFEKFNNTLSELRVIF